MYRRLSKSFRLEARISRQNREARRPPSAKFWRYQTEASGTMQRRSVEDVIGSIADNSGLELASLVSLPDDSNSSITITVFSDEWPCFVLSPEMMSVLGKMEIGIEISAYAGHDFFQT